MKLLFIFPAIIIFGCNSTPLIVDVPKTTLPVVDGVFNPDSVWSLSLSLNQDILKDLRKYQKTEVIPDNEIKTVRIRDENNALVESLQDKTEDIFKRDYEDRARKYIGQTRPESNKTYKLEIETHSYGTVTATGFVPPKVPVTSAKIENAVSSEGKRVRVATVEFSDDGNTANFYEIYILGYREDSGGNVVKTKYYYPVGFIVSDPAYSEKVNSNNSIVFDDTLFSGKQVKFSLEIESTTYTIDRVILRNITEDLYKFTIGRQAQYKNGDDEGNPFAEPVLIKGNIQNGYGIFTGFAASMHPL